MQRITKALITAAQMLGEVATPDQVPTGKINARYRGGNLQQWALSKRAEFSQSCADPDTRQVFESWMKSADDTKEIIPCLAKFIAICAIPNPPEFTPEMFPMFDDPEGELTLFLSPYQSTWNNARAEYECQQVEAGENIAEVQAAAIGAGAAGAPDPAAVSAAAGGSSATNAAPSYIPIPNIYTVTGNKSTGDYMNQLAALGYTFRLNTVTNRIEVNGKDKSDSIESEIYLAMRDSGYKGRDVILDCINVVAAANAYNPIINYFKSLSWDGTEVLDNFVSLLRPTDPTFAGIIFRKWMISAVAKVMNHAQNSMLVLEGEQGTGKSYLARWLCPLPAYFRESAIQPDNKDHEIAACSKWIWEVKELNSTTRRADQDALKGFLTSQEFNYRPAYGRNDITRPVLASFIGTVNNSSGFLVDPTGNRRFWIIGTGAIDFEYTTLYNVNDLWAEAFARWQRGDEYTLTAEENLSLIEHQEEYKVLNMTAEAIKKYYEIDHSKANDPLWQTPVFDVREHLKFMGLSDADVNARRIGEAAKDLDIPVVRQKRNGKTVAMYLGIQKKP